MTILLYLLLIAFILIETPLVIMMVFLWTHRALNGQVAKLRRILFIVLFTKFIFMFGQIILITVSLLQPPNGTDLVLYSYTIAALLLCIVNWWAVFELRKLT